MLTQIYHGLQMIDTQILSNIIRYILQFKIIIDSMCASGCLYQPVTPARPWVGHAAYMDSWLILNIYNDEFDWYSNLLETFKIEK